MIITETTWARMPILGKKVKIADVVDETPRRTRS
jgi:hypothetical protein